MLATRQVPPNLTSTWFRKTRVTCAGWFGAPTVNCTAACGYATSFGSGTPRMLIGSDACCQMPA